MKRAKRVVSKKSVERVERAQGVERAAGRSFESPSRAQLQEEVSDVQPHPVEEAPEPELLLSEEFVKFNSKYRSRIIHEDFPDDLNPEIHEQLEVRDLYINELDQEIIRLRQHIKSVESDINGIKHKDTKIEKQQRLITQLQSQVDDKQKELENLQKEFDQAKKHWDEEKEEIEMLKREYLQENEVLRLQQPEKLQEISDMKSDIVQLSKVIKKLSSLNKDLNKKIDKLNLEITQTNERNFENEAKLATFNQLTIDYEEISKQSREMEKKNVRLNKLLERLQKGKHELEAQGRENQEVLRGLAGKAFQLAIDIYEKLRDSSQELAQSTSKQIKELEEGITKTRQSLKSRIPTEPSFLTEIEQEPPDALAQISELKTLLQEERKKQQQFDIKLAAAEQKANEFKQELHRVRGSYDQALEKCNKRSDVFKEENDSLREKIKELKEKVKEQGEQLVKEQTKCYSIESSIEQYKQRAEEYQQSRDKLETELSNLREKINKLQTAKTQKEKALAEREKRVNKVTSQIQTLQEEI